MLRRTHLFLAAMSMMLWQGQLEPKTAYAQAGDHAPFSGDDIPFSMICVADADKAIGFNWIKGDWRLTRFKAETYVINRVDRKSCHDLPPPRDPNSFAIDLSLPQACYEFKEMGQQAQFGPHACYEFAPGGPGKDLKLIVCDTDGVRAVVDGPFVMARTYPVTSDEEGVNKNSVVMAIGKCSLLTNH
jgi:hypothetical protein